MQAVLRNTIESDIEIFFTNQLDEEANYMAAFTPKDPSDKTAYMEKWIRLLADPGIHMKTVLFNEEIVGTVLKFELHGKAEITYAIAKEFWGKGIASRALADFLLVEKGRPLYGVTAFDNIASQRVLEKCGFVRTGTDRGFANARGEEIEEFIYCLS